MFTFDWLRNWTVVLNLGLNALASGVVGSGVAWLVSPPEIGIFSKVVLAAGFVPALSALAGKMQASPREQRQQALSRRIEAGTSPGRRSSDGGWGKAPPPIAPGPAQGRREAPRGLPAREPAPGIPRSASRPP